MQQHKFTLALATVQDVITAQQNLAAAQSHVVIARAIYAKTLIQYELATGTLLDRHNVVLSEAIDRMFTAYSIFLAHLSWRISNGEVSKGHR